MLQLIVFYLIYFLDVAGLSLAYAQFWLFVEPVSGMVAASSSAACRQFLLFSLCLAYPLFQSFGAPLWGTLADRLGKRRPLVGTTAMTGVAFLLTGYALFTHSLPLLFLSRILAGASAGNLAISQAGLSDLSGDTLRGQTMALLPAVGGAAWIVAPFLCQGECTMRHFSSWHCAIPYISLGGLFLSLSVAVFFLVPEEHVFFFPHREKLSEWKKSLIALFKERKVAFLLGVSLFLLVGWLIYLSYLPPFLHTRHQGIAEQMKRMGHFFAAWWIFGGVIAQYRFSKKNPGRFFYAVAALLIVGAVMIYPLLSHPEEIWIAGALAHSAGAVLTASLFARLSYEAPHKMQGRVFGCWYGALGLASILGPLISFEMSAYGMAFPWIMSSIFLALGSVGYLYWDLKKR